MIEEYVKRYWDALAVQQKFVPMLSGVYSIPVDENLTIFVSDLHDMGYRVHANIAELPDGDKESFYIKALRGNLFGDGTGGAVLGLEADGKTFVLIDILPKDIDYKNFAYALEDFCNWVEYWRDGPVKEITNIADKPYF